MATPVDHKKWSQVQSWWRGHVLINNKIKSNCKLWMSRIKNCTCEEGNVISSTCFPFDGKLNASIYITLKHLFNIYQLSPWWKSKDYSQFYYV